MKENHSRESCEKRPTAASRLPKYLTQEELARLFKAILSPRNRALFAVIYHDDLRVDEAIALTLEDRTLLSPA